MRARRREFDTGATRPGPGGNGSSIPRPRDGLAGRCRLPRRPARPRADRHTRVTARVDFETRVCTTDGARDISSATAVPHRDQWFMNGPRLAA
eukprot:5374225-Prymnesium_polylepis.2